MNTKTTRQYLDWKTKGIETEGAICTPAIENVLAFEMFVFVPIYVGEYNTYIVICLVKYIDMAIETDDAKAEKYD